MEHSLQVPVVEGEENNANHALSLKASAPETILIPSVHSVNQRKSQGHTLQRCNLKLNIKKNFLKI